MATIKRYTNGQWEEITIASETSDITAEQIGALPLYGGTMSDGARISGLGNPIDAQDATTKAYVDASIPTTAAQVGAETAGSVNSHNADANAHSTLFAGKSDRPTVVTVDDDANFTVADNCEYRLTNVGTLTMAGSTGKAHGFVEFSFDVQTVTVNVTGFTASGGDDVAEAAFGEMWEFSCDNGYILWKNWSA